MGYALYVAQQGGKHREAKVLAGFGGGGVVEVIKDHRGDTYRAVYSLRHAQAIYVLHAFQKKIQGRKRDASTRSRNDSKTASRGGTNGKEGSS
jgi:phage-related protein